MEMDYHSSGQMGIHSNITCPGLYNNQVVNRESTSVLHMSRAKKESENRGR